MLISVKKVLYSFLGTIYFLLWLSTPIQSQQFSRQLVTVDNLVPSINVSLGGVRNILQTQPIVSTSSPPTFAPVPLSSRYNETVMRERYVRISNAAQQFGLELLTHLSDAFHLNNYRRDFMISPYALWSLLLLLTEGAEDRTLEQLRTVTHISDDDHRALRLAYRDVTNYLKINISTIEVASMQALFTDVNSPVLRDFEKLIERFYGSALYQVNFHDPIKAVDVINTQVRQLTRGLIEHSVVADDLQNVNLFLLSALYFKGQWKFPFNKALTRTETFYDENNVPVGDVQMMMLEANFKYVGITELEAHVLELPYGKEDRLSMLVFLPKSGATLNKVIHNLQNVGIASVLQQLNATDDGFEDDLVELHMPKFDTHSDLSFVKILEEMGLTDVFQPHLANFSKISSHLFVSNLLHQTRIIVDEEGTRAAAVSQATLSNKATPPKFYLQRPFLYIIIEKTTKVLLFVGQLVNPNKFPYNQ